MIRSIINNVRRDRIQREINHLQANLDSVVRSQYHFTTQHHLMYSNSKEELITSFKSAYKMIKHLQNSQNGVVFNTGDFGALDIKIDPETKALDFVFLDEINTNTVLTNEED